MEQLIQQVSERAGIPEDKARTAVEFIVAQLKERLPAPIAGQIDNALGGEGDGGTMQNVKESVGGMFGK